MLGQRRRFAREFSAAEKEERCVDRVLPMERVGRLESTFGEPFELQAVDALQSEMANEAST
eukprot:726472-Lingulodinium_polyedra.AAC.1